MNSIPCTKAGPAGGLDQDLTRVGDAILSGERVGRITREFPFAPFREPLQK